MPKTKDEFKAAFKAIKKPSAPKRTVGKHTGKLEDLITATTSFEDPDVAKQMGELYKQNEKYAVDLLAYKFAKHFEDGSEKRPLWVASMPKEALAKALAKVVPDGIDSKLTQVTLERSVTGKGQQKNTAAIICERDPAGVSAFMGGKYQAAFEKDDIETSQKWLNALPPTAEGANAKLGSVMDAGDKTSADAFGQELSMLKKADGDSPTPVMDHDAVLAIAKKNPKLFAKTVLPALKTKNEFVEITAQPELRKLLAKSAPAEWAELVEATPSLKVLDGVEKSITSKKLKGDPAKVNEMFDAITNNRGIPLSYSTNTFDNNRVILTGGTQGDKDFRASQMKSDKDSALKAGLTEGAMPDTPATQCHMLLHLTKEMMTLCPGLDKPPKITQGTIDNILLTAPLTQFKGKGLLDKSFGGNVFTEAGGQTDQVLFTGADGMNSHSWIVVDGVPYDPVLGTKGGDVAKSVSETFDWNILDRVAEGSKGNFIIKGAPNTPKPKPNKMGFGTGYILTKSPLKYLTVEEAKTAAANKKEREADKKKAAEKKKAEQKT